MLLKTDLDSIYLNTVCHSPWHRMNNVSRVSIAILIYNDLPKDTCPSSDSFWTPAVILCFPKQYSLTESQGLMSDSPNIPFLCFHPEKDHFPSAHHLWDYTAVCPESQAPSKAPLLGHSLWQRSWEGWQPRGFSMIQQLHLFSSEPIRACHFKMKSSKTPETKPLIS